MTKTYSQQHRYTGGASNLKVSNDFQAPPAHQQPHSSTDEPATPRAALHPTPGAPLVSPAAVAHAEATATAIARPRLRGGGSPKAALAAAAAGSTVHVLDSQLATAPEAAGGEQAYHFPTARSPRGARAAHLAERSAAAAGRTAGRLSKYASHAGLNGVAEAAGHVLGELTPAAKWRQEVLLARVGAGLALALTLGYVLLFAPRSLGWRAEVRLLRTLGSANAVAFALINSLGFFPAILGCVAWPLLRSAKHKPRLWPYLLASTMTGAFALLSYLASWGPPKPGKAPRMPPQHLPSAAASLRVAALPGLAAGLVLRPDCPGLNASAATWAQFGYLASHSFSFHVMLLDFGLLTLLSAWLVPKDAAARGWAPAATPGGRRLLQALMLLTPAVGPGVYLLLRPLSREGGVLRRGWLRRGAAAAWAVVTYPFSLPTGGVGGRAAGAAAAGTARRPAHSTSSRSQAGGDAHRSDVAEAVAHAAEVPLPAAGAAGAAAGSAGHWLESAWSGAWSWLGQRVARLRGGGGPVASEDDGAELDAMDDGGVQIGGTAEGSGTTHSTSAAAGYAAATPATPSPFAALSLPKLGALLLPHVAQQGRRWQQGWALGPTEAPRKGKDDEDGTDMLLFSDEYDEFEYDFDASSSDDDEDEDESGSWEADSGEEEDEEGFGAGGVGKGEGGWGPWWLGGDDMDLDEELAAEYA
ncbi:hypothetical protein COO60DRAFT_1702968 [Scenedesmus sp. NREL 46B-D3]|nr:hypothetical protein COO60DRAFT_1702968 [Scenedesmus sp. NREL 46B-D3]